MDTALFIAETVGWILAIAIVYQAFGVGLDARRFPPPGKRVDVGGRCIHIHVDGKSSAGAPAVILESGIAASSPSWRLVQPEIAKLSRVITYDRAGLGWSDMSKSPVTPESILHDLRTALERAGVKPPYVYVGHSFGGLVAQLFASKHSNELAGMVLLDPPHWSEWHPQAPPEKHIMLQRGARLSRRGAWCARFGINRALLSLLTSGFVRGPRAFVVAVSGRAATIANRIVGEIRKLPPETYPILKALWSQPKCFESMAAHLEALPAVSAEVGKWSKPGVLGDLPLVLITASNHTTDIMRLHEEVPALSTRGRHLVARHSGHWIQLDQPELVVHAIRSLTESPTSAEAGG